MWQQVKPFSQSKAGKTQNMCLANVRAGYQIKNLLPDAWTAWQQTDQHKGTPPAGVDVPVFFSYVANIDGQRKNWGHIGVRLKNGKFWSDGVTYSNIAAYTSTHAPKYVGWGESVNNERVIKEEDMYKGHDAKYWYERALHYRNRTIEEKGKVSKLQTLTDKIKSLLGVKKG